MVYVEMMSLRLFSIIGHSSVLMLLGIHPCTTLCC